MMPLSILMGFHRQSGSDSAPPFERNLDRSQIILNCTRAYQAKFVLAAYRVSLTSSSTRLTVTVYLSFRWYWALATALSGSIGAR